MRSLLIFLIVSFSTAIASAVPIEAAVILRDAGLTTNALIYDGAFDVYEVHLNNPNGAATAFDLSLPSLSGDFIQVGDRVFGEDAALPLAFGFVAPDTFFVVPVVPSGGVCLGLDCGPIDDASNLSASYSSPVGHEAVSSGSSVIAVLSVPAGSAVPNFRPSGAILGHATIDGVFENIIVPVPEPTTVLLALFGVAGVAACRRC